MDKNEYARKLKDDRWIEKRREILERDGFQCQSCEDFDGIMEVHHEYYEDGRDPWDYPNDALVTLCSTCHRVEESGRKKAFKRLNKAIADAGFTREDVEKLASAFEEMQVKPYYSYRVMSGIYREAGNFAYKFKAPRIKTKEDLEFI